MPSSIINSDDGVISGTSGLKSSGGDDGVLNIQNNGTTAVTVNASGNVGIGITPSAWGSGQKALQNGTRAAFVGGSAGQTLIGNNYFSNGTNNIYLATAAASLYEQFSGSHFFYTAPSGTAGNNITFTERVCIDSNGIKFNGDTAAANALDDYEEGTFTPTATGGATPGTTTYTNQVGGYTKIGRQVTVTIYIRWTAATGSGGLRIGGLPFTSASGLLWTGSCFTDSLNWTGGTYQTLYIGGGSAAISLYGASDDGVEAEQTITNETASIYGTLTYFV